MFPFFLAMFAYFMCIAVLLTALSVFWPVNVSIGSLGYKKLFPSVSPRKRKLGNTVLEIKLNINVY